MALVSLKPKNIYDIVALLAKEQQKYILVIDNHKYSDLTTDQKTAVKAYYTDNDANGDPQWIIPEAEIDEIFASEDIFYIFDTEQQAVDNCCEWFPQPKNLPDVNHRIYAYVVKPDGTIPYVNDICLVLVVIFLSTTS